MSLLRTLRRAELSGESSARNLRLRRCRSRRRVGRLAVQERWIVKVAIVKKRSTRKKHRVVDHAAVHELDLFAENKYELYNQKKSILANVLRRRKNGTYDAKKAPKLWMYWVDSASKQYRREFPGTTFDKSTREALAAQLAKRYSKGVE